MIDRQTHEVRVMFAAGERGRRRHLLVFDLHIECGEAVFDVDLGDLFGEGMFFRVGEG